MPLKMHDSPQRRKSANAGVRIIGLPHAAAANKTRHAQRIRSHQLKPQPAAEERSLARSCPDTWCNIPRHVGFPVLPGCQVATAGKMTMGLSLTGAIPASVM